jgi:hypothetical protein
MAQVSRWVLGAILTMTASAALACPPVDPCGRRGGDAYRSGYEARTDLYAPPPEFNPGYDRVVSCDSACGGEIQLPSSFFAGSGGVGPIPSGPEGYGGGFVIVGGSAFAGARASASASASVSVRTSVSISGGGRGGHGGHGGCCH